MFKIMDDPSEGDRLYDAISPWHPKKCNFSYADGHAEQYRWKDSRTHDYALKLLEGVKPPAESAGTTIDNEDIRFLAEGYRAR